MARMLVVVVLVLLAVVAWLAWDDGAGVAGEAVSLRTGSPEAVPLPEPQGGSASGGDLGGLGLDAPAPTATEATPLRPGAARRTALPTRRVAGRFVRAATGTPLRVPMTFSFLRGSVDHELLFASDDRGVFDVQAPTGTDGLRVRSASLITGGPQEIRGVLPEEGDVTGLRIEVDTGWAVAVEVRDEVGRPVPGARVVVQEEGPRATDAEGRVTLEDLALGENPRAWVSVRHPLHGPALELVNRPAGASLVGPLRIELARGGAVEGDVFSGTGAPLVGVRILLLGRPQGYFDDLEPAGVRTRSDEAGHYRLEGLPPGRVSLEVMGSDLPPLHLPPLEVQSGRTTWHDVVLGDPVPVRGQVVDGDGRPMAGLQIRASHVERWVADEARGEVLVDAPEGRRKPSTIARMGGRTVGRARITALTTVHTDGTGRFLAEVRPGLVQLDVEGAHPRYVPPEPVEVVVPQRGVPEPVSLVLTEGLRLRGRVTDREGLPVRSALVAASATGRRDVRLHARTDGAGHFLLEGLPAERLEVRVSRVGYSAWEGEARAGPAVDLLVVLEPATSLWVRVTDASTGEPLEHYDVIVNSEDESVMRRARPVEGLAEAQVRGDGPCQVMIRSVGYATVVVEDVVPAATTAAQPLEVALVP